MLLLQLHEAKQALTYTVIPLHSVGTFRGLGWNWNQPDGLKHADTTAGTGRTL